MVNYKLGMTVFITRTLKASLLDISRLIHQEIRWLSPVFNGLLPQVSQNIKIISSQSSFKFEDFKIIVFLQEICRQPFCF